MTTTLTATAYDVAARVTDPEMPMLTLADLGVLRAVDVVDRDGRSTVVVAITPTYSGCPAMASMRDDLVRGLNDAGFEDVQVRVVLEPAWSSDWISERGRAALQEHGVSAPGPVPTRGATIPLSLGPTRRRVSCPRCGAAGAVVVSEFGATACTALYRCAACLEPFTHVKEI
jgi:ring-1,2-phenylacetyl-CoA epoxidase subunit PaaD